MSALRKLLATTPFPRPEPLFSTRKSSPEPVSPTPPATDRPSTLPPPQPMKVLPIASTPLPTISEQRSLSQPRLDQKAKCPLEKLLLQPVGTSDHYLDRCFCYLCKCGEHKCPAEIKKEAMSPSMKRGVKSKYQEEYTKREHKPVKSMMLHFQSSMPHPKGMDLKTTKQMDFRDPGVAVVPHRPHRDLQKSLKLVTRSSYQRDFPNWKPGETVLFKCLELPYRGDIVGFNTKTTYQEEFVAEKPAEHFKNTKAKTRVDPIAVLNDFYGTTSHKTEFQQPSKVYEISSDKTPKSNFRNTSEWFLTPPIRSLTTTYRQEFNPKEHPLKVPFKHKAKRSAELVERLSEEN